MPKDPLPRIMVAPTGARRTKADHPALPVTIAEIVETAKACFAAGAGGIHAHVRDAEQCHVLDAGLYREIIAEIGRSVPDMLVQITTEAAGIFTPSHQRDVVRAVEPVSVSVALSEMIPDTDTAEASAFYHWADEAGIAIQHILYSPKDVLDLAGHVAKGIIPGNDLQTLFVLGRYTKDQESDPADLDPFLSTLTATGLHADWAICAFGHSETDCLARAFEMDGKVRAGFENSFYNRDGTLARDNAERISEIACLPAPR